MKRPNFRRTRNRALAAGVAGLAFLLSAGGAMAQQHTGHGTMNQGTMNMGKDCSMMSGGMTDGSAGQGMMGSGMMQGGMMQGGMMGQGGMQGGMMHQGMMQGGMTDGSFVMTPARPMLTVADVTQNLERILAAKANSRLKLGQVTEKDANTIIGEIVTVDGSVVERYEVDRRSWMAKLVP